MQKSSALTLFISTFFYLSGVLFRLRGLPDLFAVSLHYVSLNYLFKSSSNPLKLNFLQMVLKREGGIN